MDIGSWEFGRRHFTADSEGGGRLALRMFYWPGWTVRTIDLDADSPSPREVAAVAGTDGRMQFELSPGRFNVAVIYRGTAAERLGMGLSGLTVLVGLSALLGEGFKKTKRNVSLARDAR